MGWREKRLRRKCAIPELYTNTIKNKVRTICTCFKTSQTMYRTHTVAWAAAQQLESRQPDIFFFSFPPCLFPVPPNLCFTATSFRGYTCTRGCFMAAASLYESVPRLTHESKPRSNLFHSVFTHFSIISSNQHLKHTEAGDCDVTRQRFPVYSWKRSRSTYTVRQTLLALFERAR